MDTQAIALNNIIQKHNAGLLGMLSEKGKNIFFPKLGILAQSAQAKGKEINATIGEAVEDDGSSMHLSDFESLINLPINNVFPYAPSYGKKEFRDLWRELLYKKNPSLNGTVISTPISTNGVTHGLSIAGYLFADAGDEIVLSNLFWENYSLVFENAYEAKIKTFNLFKNGKFDIEDFTEKINSVKNDKLIILLNFPNNPSGYTPLISEAKEIVNEIEKLALKGKKIVVFIDDAYFGLVYEENVYKESIFTELAKLNENILAVKLDGPTKEDYVWGFRVGLITYGIKNGTPELFEALEAKTAGAIRGNISNISHLTQSLLLKVYKGEKYNDDKLKKYNILKNRYKILKDTIYSSKYSEYIDPLPFNSGYFMCVRLKKGINTEEVRKHLLEKYNTGVIVFGDVIRLAFSAVPQSKIPKLIENLYSACLDIENMK
jgi:aspartate/methionine/tyrosine aminotransferase